MRDKDVRAERKNKAARAGVSSRELSYTRVYVHAQRHVQCSQGVRYTHVCTHTHRDSQARELTAGTAARIKSQHRSQQHHAQVVALADWIEPAQTTQDVLSLSFTAESTATTIS